MPVGFRIASAWVDIRAEDKGLKQQIKEAVEKASKGNDVKIPLKIDSKGLRREVEDALKEATKGQKPKVEIAIKSTGLRKEVSDALKRATEKQKPTVKLSINSAGLRREVQNALNLATKDQKPTVRLGISSVGLRQEVQRALTAATAGQDGHVTIHADLDTDGIKRALADTHPTIRPDVDVKHMRQTLMAAIRRINVNDSVHINPNIDGNAMANQIKSEIARLRDKFRVPLTPDINVSTFEAKIRAAAKSVSGNNTDIPIDLNPNINRLKLRADAAAAAASIRAKINFNGELNTAMTRAKLMASLKLAQLGAHITIPVRYDTKQLHSLFGDIESGFRSIEGPTGRWSKIIQAGALGALPAFALVDHAIRSTGASAAVAVPMLTMMTAAFAAAKIGMQGMGTVISGVFNEQILTNHQFDVLDVTMKGLAPNALRFANALKNVKGEFTGLRTGVQQILFSNLDVSLNQFAKQTLPTLKLGLAGTASQLNQMTIGFVNVLNTASRTGELKMAFGAIQTAMAPLIPMPGQLLNAIIKLTIAASPLLLRMTTSLETGLKKMTSGLAKGFANGQLQASITKAGDTIVNFFRRIANNPELNKFMDRMKANGPNVAKTFGDIATALMKIVNALAPISGVVMTVVDAFAKFIDKIPTIFLEAFIIKLFIFKTALGVASLVKNVVTALGALKLSLIALQGPTQMAAALGPRLAALGMSAGAIRGTAAALGAFAKIGLTLAAITFTFQTLSWAITKLFGDGRIHANMNKMSTDLVQLRETGRSTGEVARVFGKDFGKFGEAVQQIAHPGTFDRIAHGFKRVGEAIGINGDSWQKNNDVMKAGDKTLTDLVKKGDMTTAAALYRQMAAAALKNHTSVKKLNSLLPGYQQALKDAKAAQKTAADTMGVFGKKAMEVSGRLQQLKTDTDGLVQSLFALNNTQRDANQAVRDMETAATAMVAATKKKAIGLKFENGQLIQNTKAQQDAAAAIEDYAGKTEKSAIATYQANGNWEQASKTLEDGRKAIIKAAEAAGMGTDAATAYANSIFKIPSKKEVNLMLVDQATSQLQDVAAAFRATPDQKTITVSTLNNAAIKGLEDLGYKVKQLPDGSFTVTAKTKQSEADLARIEKYKINPKTVEIIAQIAAFTTDIQKAQAKVDSLKQKRKTAVGADKAKLDKEITAAQRKVDSLKQKRKAAIEALDKTGPGVKSAQRHIDGVHGKTVDIWVKTHLSGPDPSSVADSIRKQAQRFSGKRYGGVIHRASGGGVPGSVVGPGGPTSDRVPAMLSNGEFVIRAAAVSKYGMGLLQLINTGRFPKFASGGVVGAATGASAGSGVKVGETTGTFTVKDGTGKPVASAVANFKVLRSALSQAYADMQQKSTIFGTQFALKADATYKAASIAGTNFSRKQVSDLMGTNNKSQAVWNSWKTGMTARTSSTYKTLAAQTGSFQRNTTSSTSKTSSSTQSIWNAWKSGMVAKTSSTYKTLNSATSSFRSQSVSAIGKARDGMGSAWSGLSPKFKPPVSYLVHTVINSGVVGSMNAIMSKLGGGKKVSGISVAGFARGGPIYGEGSATSDSIPARLSNGEFVMQAKAVKKFGVGFMHQVNNGSMPGQGAGYKPGFATGGLVNIRMAPGFATGGSVPSSDTLNKILGDGGDAGSKRMTNFIMDNYVLPLINSGPGGSAMKDVQRAGVQHIQSNVEKFVKENFGGAGSASAGLRWAKTQYGKPYQWGGNGNPSWDCSGFMSAIESVIRGEKPHRRWATGSFGSSGPPGWKRNAKAPFQIGITNAGVGHTAGTIGKENVESSGGIGVHGGVGVPRGANDGMFTSRWGYVGPNATKKASGGYISGPGGPTSDVIPAMLSNGEFVIRAAAVKKLGTSYLNALNTGSMRGFAKGGSTTTYKVKSGDTLSEIAAHFHTTTSALMALNKSIKNANKIYAGQTLVIKKAVSSSKSSGGSSKSSSSKSKGKSDVQDASNVTALTNLSTLREAQVIANQHGAHYVQENLGNIMGQDSLDTLVSNLTTVRSSIYDAFKGHTQDVLAAKFTSTANKLIPLQMKLDKVTASLASAQDALDEVKQKFDSLKSSVSESITDFGKITKIGTYGTSPTVLLNQLQSDVTKSQAFTDQLTQLKNKGVSGDLIQQIAEAGLSGGGSATATTLLQMTPEQIKQLNALQSQLTTTADKAGTVTADAMYGAGVQAAQGLVDGLKSQQKAIEAQMKTIADGLLNAIRAALGIKSPSRRMMEVGNFTIDGLRNQLIARAPEVARAMENLAVVPTPTIPAANVAYGQAGTIAGGSNVTYVTIENITVDGTFQLDTAKDRKTLAKSIVKEIKEEIRKDDKAHR